MLSARTSGSLLALAMLSAPPSAVAEAPSLAAASEAPGGTTEAPSEALPAPPPKPPRVDLRRIRFTDGKAVAPAGAQGLAELTLRAPLQQAAEDLLRDAAAAASGIVAVDARTLEVVVFSERTRSGGSRGVLVKPEAPAASVFKLVTTAALFESTPLTPRERVCTAGGERAVERRHLDVPRGGDVRCAPFSQALGHSRNAAYAQLATRYLLRTDLVDVAERIGFNHDVPFDAAAPLGKLTVPYNDLEFARTATGFKNSSISVLGGAYLAALVAHGGQVPHLRIVRKAGDYEAPTTPELGERVLRASTARRLAHMMEVTVRSGTAHHSFTDENGRSYLGNVRVAGKTGTLKPAGSALTTTWFIGFAPAESPRLIVSVLLQNGNVWRRKAAEVARDLLRAYFAEEGARGVTAPELLAARQAR